MEVRNPPQDAFKRELIDLLRWVPDAAVWFPPQDAFKRELIDVPYPRLASFPATPPQDAFKRELIDFSERLATGLESVRLKMPSSAS